MFEKVFILALFLKYIFIEYRILGWQLISFITLKMLLHCHWFHIVFRWEICCHSYIYSSVGIVSFFFTLADVKILSLSAVLSNMIIMCHVVLFIIFLMLGVHQSYYICGLTVFIKLQKIDHCLFKYFLLSSFFFCSFETEAFLSHFVLRSKNYISGPAKKEYCL